MADFIPITGKIQPGIETPITLTAMQKFCGGFIKFIDLLSGDMLVVNEAGIESLDENKHASSIAGRKIYGPAVLCTPREIA